MNLYNHYILPHLINCACGMKAVQRQRANVVPRARGRVLEVGMGSGLNLPYYDSQRVEMIIGLEPSAAMFEKATPMLRQTKVQLEWLQAECENIPLCNSSIDSVVLTYALCTIKDTSAALSEIKRVLKSDGKLFFCEHGLAPHTRIQAWQHRLNPVWKRLAGGCHLNRDVAKLISTAGFEFEELNNGYIEGPRIATFQYWGVTKFVEKNKK